MAFNAPVSRLIRGCRGREMGRKTAVGPPYNANRFRSLAGRCFGLAVIFRFGYTEDVEIMGRGKALCSSGVWSWTARSSDPWGPFGQKEDWHG